MRSRRGLLTRWELAAAVLVLGAVLAYAIPVVQRAIWRTRLAEAPWFLDALAVAANTSGGKAPALPPTPRALEAVGSDAVPWPSPPPNGWSVPHTVARCAYASSTMGGYHLVAVCDVDGDGVRAYFQQFPGKAVERLTPYGVW